MSRSYRPARPSWEARANRAFRARRSRVESRWDARTAIILEGTTR